MRFIHPQTNFRAGRMSSKMYGQVEVKEYFEGLSVAENGFVSKQGGFSKRNGTQVVMALDLEDSERNLITVTMFKNKSYHFLFTDSKLRILDTAGHMMAESPSFTFLAGQLLDPSEFSLACFENTVFITHYSGLLKPLTAKFTSEVTVFIDTIPVNSMFNIPFNDPNTNTALKVRVKNVNNLASLQLEANYNLFTPSMVGEFFRVVGLTNFPPPTNNSNDTAKALVSDVFYISSYVSATLVNVTPSQTVTFKAEPVGGGIAAPLDYCVFANFNADNELKSVDSLWQSEFNEQAWNSRYGWPRTVTVDEGRLIFGGTPNKPLTFYGSRTGNPLFFMDKRFVTSPNATPFWDYAGDILETDPYQFTISSKYSTDITFMESSVSFIIGTGRQEFIVSGAGSAISKKNISVRPHTSHGSAPLLSTSSDNTIFYVGKTREQLFLFKYNESNGSYISKEISVLNDDVFLKKIKGLTWHDELSCLFVLLDTNEIVTVTHLEEMQTLALATHSFPDPIHAVSYAISSDEDDYAVFLTEKNGKFFIEYLDRKDIASLPVSMQELSKKLPHGDNLRVIRPFETRYIKCIHGLYDVINCDRSAFVKGQEVVFTSTNPTALAGTGLSLNTPYYAIPFANAYVTGIRLATSLANAQANIHINITPDTDFFFDVVSYSLRMDSNRLGLSTINVENLEDGQEVTIYHDDNGVLGQMTYTKLVGQTEFDTGLLDASSFAIVSSFKMTMATMPLEAGQQYGTAQMALKRLDNVAVRFTNTLSFKVSTDGYNEEEVVYNEYTTGRKELAITANSEYDQRVFITNDKIEPCYINNLSMRGVANDG